MLKEIFEQPNTVRDAMRGRLNPDESTARLGGLNMGAPNCAMSGELFSPDVARRCTPLESANI